MDAPTPVDGTSAANAPDGRTVGRRYTLRSSVGSGGMGTVWRAFDELLRREVAVKEVLLPAGIPAPERAVLCERTLREARAAAALNHPAVIRVYDVVNDGDRPWIVMELLDAASLADTLRDEGPLPYDRVAEIGLAVLGALEAAHRVGVLHRDVKPGNVLLGIDGRVTLTDFGVARSPNESPLTSTGLLLGSPQYIAPERARGRPFGPPSDLFSLGATLYTAVEGRPPFDRGDPLPTMTAVVVEPPDQMAFAGPLAPVLLGLLEKDPEQRWDSIKTRNALRTVLSGGRITSLDGGGGGRAPRQPAGPADRAQQQQQPARRRPDAPGPNGAMPAGGPGMPPPPPPGGAGSNRPSPPAPPGAPPTPPGATPAAAADGTPGQRGTAEGTAAMAVNPFTTDGVPSLPPPKPDAKPGDAAANAPDQPGSHRPSPHGPGGQGAARPGAGRATVRGSVSVPGQQAPGQQAQGQPPISGYARVPGVAPAPPHGQPPGSHPQGAGYGPSTYGGGYGGSTGYGEQPQPTGYGEQPPQNSTAPLPSAPPSANPRRSAYMGGHTMVSPSPAIPDHHGQDGRRRTMLIVAAIVVAVILIGLISYLVSVLASGDDNASPSRSTTSAATGSGVQLTSYDYPDRGFTLKAPADWSEKKAETYVDYDGPQGDKLRALIESGSSPEQHLKSAENYQKQRLTKGQITAFETVHQRESAKKLGGRDTWEWEFTYTESNVRKHRVWRVAVVDGKAYNLYLTTADGDFAERLPLYDEITASFTFDRP
ncbi:serine/threonine-protein kinase [Cryptosporangium arvum]|uniref:serine/threonine-protein kinase n=1 Tax=Cryptosporangium arvum TaxID=80871 RepID=UPI0024818653|nr:serine/threonine-protein kinase [Cryptosporangium arvum]